jgi:hypothetical protein
MISSQREISYYVWDGPEIPEGVVIEVQEIRRGSPEEVRSW